MKKSIKIIPRVLYPVIGLSILAVIFITTAPVLAADRIWTGAGTDNNWSTTQNWVGNLPPLAGQAERVIYNGSSLARLTTGVPEIAGLTDISILMETTVPGSVTVTAGGNVTVTSGASVTNQSVFLLTIVTGITLSGDVTFTGTGGNLAFSGSIDTAGYNLNLITNATCTMTGTISGAGDLAFDGGGVLNLNIDSTHTGSTTIGSGQMFLTGALNNSNAININALGTLTLNAANRIVDTAAVTLASNGTLNLNGRDETIGSLSGLAFSNVTLGAGTLTFGDGNDTTFSGNITGTGNLVKQGSGILTLDGADSLTGSVTLTDGTMLVQGGIANHSGLTVQAGATLGGYAPVGHVTVLSGGTFSPGLNPGNPATARIFPLSLVMNPGSNLNIELNGLAPGPGYDQVEVNGPITLNSPTLNFSLGFAASVGDSFTIVNMLPPGPIAGIFNGLPEGAELVSDDRTWSITYTGDADNNDVVLTLESLSAEIPTLSEWGMIILSMLLGTVAFYSIRKRSI